MIKIGTMVVVMQTYPIQPFATLSNHRFAIDEIICGNNAARVTASTPSNSLSIGARF